jgi:hypothetical protein
MLTKELSAKLDTMQTEINNLINKRSANTT